MGILEIQGTLQQAWLVPSWPYSLCVIVASSDVVLNERDQQVHPALVVLVLKRKRSFIDNSTFTAISHRNSMPVKRIHEHMSTLRFAQVETHLQGMAESISSDPSGVHMQLGERWDER